MQQGNSFVIVVVVIGLCLMVALFIVQKALMLLSKQNDEQRKTISTLTNLAASKDFTAFSALESAGEKSAPHGFSPMPMLNDEAVAHALAAHYSASGLDPSLAYANDGDGDPLEDFGGREALFGKSE